MKKIIFLILLILFSCVSEKEDILRKIEGIWLIENVTYINQNITSEFYVNTLIFEKGKLQEYVSIPKSENYDSENALINIKSTNEKSYLVIESLNKKINGIYEIYFYENSKVVELKSKKTSIKLSKLPTVEERIF
jgi:hypothetical protein